MIDLFEKTQTRVNVLDFKFVFDLNQFVKNLFFLSIYLLYESAKNGCVTGAVVGFFHEL